MKNAICTIVSKNYLSYARTLIDSFALHNKGVDMHVLLVDRVDGYFDPYKENFILTTLEQLEIQDEPSFCFKYNVTELNTAVKPFFLDYLFKNCGYDKVIYFDPDILIMNNLDELFSLLDSHSAVLTPHITSPIADDGKLLSEINLLMSGAYNLGFIGFSHYEKIGYLLSWWKERLYKYCFSAPDKGLFVDQKWIDLLPGMLEDVCILRHPGYNTAYWNLHERTITCKDGGFRVNGQPVYFFHFSGFVFDNIECISKYQNRFKLGDLQGLGLLFEKYKALVAQRGYAEARQWPYAYGIFDNGVKIPGIIRQFYLGLMEQGKKFGNPFITTGPDSFFEWLNQAAITGKPVTNLLGYIYCLRADLQGAFPDHFTNNLSEFMAWARQSLKKEYDFDDKLMPFSAYKEDAMPQNIMEKSVTTLEMAHSKATDAKDMAKALVWRYGLKHARLIKNIPLLNMAAQRAYDSLARENIYSPAEGDAQEAVRRLLDKSELKASDEGAGFNIAGYIDTESGIGEATRGIIDAVRAAGVPFALKNIEQQFYRRNDKTYTDFSDANPYPLNILHVNADQVPYVAKQLGDNFLRGKYNIGYWYWELSEFPDAWLDAFSFFNEIWVASDFCLDTISRVSPVPVVKIPPSVAIKEKGIYDREHFGINPDNFTFLMMFDFRSFIERKNPMAVIDAFKLAFAPDENVTLVIKCTNSDGNQAMLHQLRDKVAGANVKIIEGYLDAHEINDLLAASDAYVSLHRSEGLGLPMAEAMLMGKPVIATAYSGNLEFMNINNSFLVKYRLTELEKDAGPYRKGNVWANPDISHAAELMRFVSEHREAAGKKGEVAREDVRRQLNPETIGRKIRKRMDGILSA